MRSLLIIAVVFLASCSTIERLAELQNPPVEKGYKQYQPAIKGQSIHFYVEQLARQLLDTTNQFDVTQSVVVGTFLPSESLKHDPRSANAPFGIQIQESFITFLTQAGLNVVEIKIRKEGEISSHADIFVSRDLNSLETQVHADYLLVGSYTEQQNELVVNTRLVNLSDKTVVAAATDYIPKNVMWSHEKVTLKDNQIYRGEY